MKIQSIYEAMLSNCLKCRKNTESKNPKVVKTENGRIMHLSKCIVFSCKKKQHLSKCKTLVD